MPAPLVKLATAPDLVDRVYRALLDAIVDGSMAAGARLTQDDIARQLAVSRQPVLQALRLLKADGLLLDAPGRGLLVAPLNGEGIADVYQVRAALDRLAARLAAQRRAVLPPGLIERGRQALRGHDVAALIDADAAFHDAIYLASGNPMIGPSAHVHWHHIRRAMGQVLRRAGLRETVWDEHQAIAAAIARGDADLAEQLIAGHDQRASEFMRQQLGPADPAEDPIPQPGDDDETQRRTARAI